MITLRRNAERRHVEKAELAIWSTFDPQRRPAASHDALGLVTSFDELRLQPGSASAMHVPNEAEIVLYLHRGALAQESSNGSSIVVQAGEFQRMVTGRGIRHRETSASPTQQAHLFRITLRPAQSGLECSQEQRRFTSAQRRNMLCTVASSDGRRGSLRILQDAQIFSSIIDPGTHLIHELAPGRSAWLHLIDGEVKLQDLILTRGDGVGVTLERSVSFTAQTTSEILLVDVGRGR